MDWHVKTFDELSTNELYQVLKLRNDVFVVEQDCAYSDIDGLDIHPQAYHLFAKQIAKPDNPIACYLRILPPDLSYPNMPSFGRVVIDPESRGQGLGHEMMRRTLFQLDQVWPELTCHISAQAYLKNYYAKHGFQIVGKGYLEDGIPHIGMERAVQKPPG